MNQFDELLSFNDAAQIWGVTDSALRKAVATGKLVEGEDCKKFGKQWVVAVKAMAREYRGGYAPWSNHKVELRKKEIAERGY